MLNIWDIGYRKIMKIFVKAKPDGCEEKVAKIDETHWEIITLNYETPLVCLPSSDEEGIKGRC